MLLSACSDDGPAAAPALDLTLPTIDVLAPTLDLPDGWSVAGVDPAAGLILAHEVGALPEGTISYATSATYEVADADAYFDAAITRLGTGRDQFELLDRQDQPFAIDGARSMRFRAGAVLDGIPLEVSALVLVGNSTALIAQVVHEARQYEQESGRVDELFGAVVEAVRGRGTST